jgi:ribonuclease P protein component
MSVSSRVGGAVRRNRIKRLVREFFRLEKGSLPESTDLLVSARKGVRVKDYKDVQKELGFLTEQG